MESNAENCRSFDIVKKCIGYDLLALEPGEPMSNEDFGKELSKILGINVKIINEWKTPRL